MSKYSKFIMLMLVTLLTAACQSAPVAIVDEQQPDVAALPAIDSPATPEPEAETETEAIDYNQQFYEQAIGALKNGDTELAIELLTQLTQDAPDKPRLFTNLGLAYFRMQQADAAEQAFQQAVAHDPDDAVAHNHLGILQRHKGRFQEALTQYQRAIEIDDSYASAHLNLGILFDLYLQDLEKALQQYQKYQVLSSGENASVSGWIIDIERRLKAANKQSQG